MDVFFGFNFVFGNVACNIYIGQMYGFTQILSMISMKLNQKKDLIKSYQLLRSCRLAFRK